MKQEVLLENLAKTLSSMKEQTGKEPGAPTGLCHKVVVGALTGADLDFTNGTNQSLDLQMEEEATLGLVSYPIYCLQTANMCAVGSLLETVKYPVDALLIAGKVTSGLGSHLTAIVLEDESPSYHVIDSLLDGAHVVCPDVGSVLSLVRKRFEPTTESIRVVPTVAEREDLKKYGTHDVGILMLGDGIRMLVPFKQIPVRFSMTGNPGYLAKLIQSKLI